MASPPKPKARASKPAASAARPTGLRIIINGVEGVGKTTLGAYAPNPVIVMAPGETGFLTLRQFGLVPDVPHVPADNWQNLLNLLSSPDIAAFDSVVLDALGGFERLCHEHVCLREFKGDWGERGFMAYQKGFDIAVADWLRLLRVLDDLAAAGKLVLLLSHVAVKNFRNPMGADYDRYVSDCHSKTWGVTHRWADAVLFYTFFSVIKERKGVGGTTRMLYCTRTDAYDAKNRFGLPDVIDVPEEPSKSFGTMWNAIQTRKEVQHDDLLGNAGVVDNGTGPTAE